MPEEEIDESTRETKPTSSSNLKEIFGGVASMTILLLIFTIFYFKLKTKRRGMQDTDKNLVQYISFPYRYNFKTTNGIYRVPALDRKLSSISEESLSNQSLSVQREIEIDKSC